MSDSAIIGYSRKDTIDPASAFMPKDSECESERMKMAMLCSLLFTLILLWAPELFSITRSLDPPPAKVEIPPHFAIKPKPELPKRQPLRERSKLRPVIFEVPPESLDTRIDPDQHTIAVPDPVLFPIEEDVPLLGPPEAPDIAGPVTAGTKGLIPPVFIKKVSPKIPRSMSHRLSGGYILLETVLKADGTIGDIKIVKRMGGAGRVFADEAIEALKKWEFLPGKLNGSSVDVRMTLMVRVHVY